MTPNDQTLQDFFEKVFAPRRLRGRSPLTRYQYGIQFRHFARFLERDARLSDLNDDTVSQFLGWLVDGGRAAPTANKARNHICSLWNFAARKRFVDEFPEVEAIIEPEIVPRAWTESQLAALFEACHKMEGWIGNVPARRWWWALHNMFLDTAERTWATLSIQWTHLDLDRQWVSIPAELRKGKRKALSTELHLMTVAALRAIEEPKRELVFEWPWTRGYFYKRYNKLLKQAGLPTDRRCKPQKMRRSVASHLEAAGINATPILRHSSRKVTEQSYIDPSIARQVHPAQVLKRPGQHMAQSSGRKLPPPLAG